MNWFIRMLKVSQTRDPLLWGRYENAGHGPQGRDQAGGFEEPPRPIEWSKRMNVLRTSSLEGPPDQHPILWGGSNGKPASIVRWMWHPDNGDMLVDGDPSTLHAQMMHNNKNLFQGRKFDSWVRGLYFPKDKAMAVRTYFSPDTPYDEFDATHKQRSDAINQHMINLLKKHLKDKSIVYHPNVNNNYLKGMTGMEGARF
jgi:hypothetical protein